MPDHAFLSPSGASRWLTCTPSARMEENFPDKGNPAAEEGTLAHKLAELLLKYKLKRIKKEIYDRRLLAIHRNKYYEPAMLDYVTDYVSFVLEKFEEAKKKEKGAAIFLEQKLDLSNYVPKCFGTGDVIIITEHFLHLIDLKYGKGVPVTAVENKQTMLYSLGAFDAFDYAFDIQEVEMTIHQPRLDSITNYSISKDKLLTWANNELKPRAALAYNGKGEFVAGEHCRFCKAKAVCRANAEYNLEVTKHDFADPELLSDTELVEIIEKADLVKSWVSDVEKYVLQQALDGKKWAGYKLVEGRSNRVYSDTDKVAKKLLDAGYTEDMIYESKLLGITAMERILTKSVFNAELKDLVIKPPGKPTLVPVSDPREEYNNAITDFSNIKI